MTPQRPRCTEIVYTPEQMRRTGRGPSGFELHYTRDACKRLALPGKEKCWQHDAERGRIASDKAWETRKASRHARRMRRYDR